VGAGAVSVAALLWERALLALRRCCGSGRVTRLLNGDMGKVLINCSEPVHPLSESKTQNNKLKLSEKRSKYV